MVARLVVPAAVAALTTAPGIAEAAWNQPVGGATPIRARGGQPHVTEIGVVPYVAWQENDGTKNSGVARPIWP
jgi:hypothetical protein